MKKRSHVRDAGGFTLIEVMISMFFILFIIQGVSMTALYAQKSGIYSRRLTSANMIAEKALERYRNIDYDNLATFNGQQICFNVHMNELGSCADVGAVFTQDTTVSAGPAVNISQVDVTVIWVESLSWSDWHSAGPQEAKVVSYISRY
jgi:Tfp pilus assembly protein PilV